MWLSNVVLTRAESGDAGTFGRIVLGEFAAYTGELPDRANQSNLSCIPAGSYRCAWTYSPHLKRSTYEVLAVPSRAGIRIHSANLMGDATKGLKAQLNGCIALGESRGVMDGQKALLLSRPAVRRFEAILNEQPFTLEIR